MKGIRFYDFYSRGICLPLDVLDMVSPVRCRCGRYYDLGRVQITARYTDCSIWTTPCCHTVVDDRGGTGWKSFSDYEPVDVDDIRRLRRNQFQEEWL